MFFLLFRPAANNAVLHSLFNSFTVLEILFIVYKFSIRPNPENNKYLYIIDLYSYFYDKIKKHKKTAGAVFTVSAVPASENYF